MEYEHVKTKSYPGKCVHHGSIERLFVGEHPGPLRHGEGEVVLVPEPEEDVLQGGAPSLVSFSESHLHNSRYRVSKKGFRSHENPIFLFAWM